jgi:hypothetical protein
VQGNLSAIIQPDIGQKAFIPLDQNAGLQWRDKLHPHLPEVIENSQA